MTWTVRPAAVRRIVELIAARPELAATGTDPRPVEVRWARPTYLNRRHVWIASVRQEDPLDPTGFTGPDQPQPYQDQFAVLVQMCAAIPGRGALGALDDITPLLEAVTAALACNKRLARDTDPDPDLDGAIDITITRIDGPDIVEVPEGPQAWAQVVAVVDTVISGT